MNKLFISIFSLLILASCNESEKLENNAETAYINDAKLGVSIKKSNDLLVFDSNSDFQKVISIIDTFSNSVGSVTKSVDGIDQYYYSQIINSEDISLEKDGFHSLYDDFVNAMDEAESYYDRPGGYQEFKEKYSMLYFPEEGDDYSAYLPVSNKNIAKLLNSKGEVMIDGKVVNLKDINSYQQLIDLGEAPLDDELISINTKADADYPLNELPTQKCNNRKLWVNTHLRPGSNGVLEEIDVEVCFRKKGAFGAWYNYSSETTLGWEPGLSYHKFGYSSHDYIFARVYRDGAPVPFAGLMYVIFRGFGSDCGDTRYYFRVNL